MTSVYFLLYSDFHCSYYLSGLFHYSEIGTVSSEVSKHDTESDVDLTVFFMLIMLFLLDIGSLYNLWRWLMP